MAYDRRQLRQTCATLALAAVAETARKTYFYSGLAQKFILPKNIQIICSRRTLAPAALSSRFFFSLHDPSGPARQRIRTGARRPCSSTAARGRVSVSRSTSEGAVNRRRGLGRGMRARATGLFLKGLYGRLGSATADKEFRNLCNMDEWAHCAPLLVTKL